VKGRKRRRPRRKSRHHHPSQVGDRKLHILLTEDNKVNQTLAVRLLEKRATAWWWPATAKKHWRPWRTAGIKNFDAVLMDIQMPGMDGFEATAAIRARDNAQGVHTPIVAMTAHAMKGDEQCCLEAGMDGYVSKPIRIADLLEEIRKQLPEVAGAITENVQAAAQ
jgi:two-component system, sensor histidine kinase and response regulator